MWKVIAADDESYVIEALQKLINWQNMNCELIAVVKDGHELIKKVEELEPDIVITDIRMPEKNGIEVCRYLYERYPEIQKIILTAYSDFTYAKAAIKYNVCEYVLKVSIIEELPQAILKATEQLDLLMQSIKRDELFELKPLSIVQQIDHYIAGNFQKKLSLDEIADALHINSSYLSRVYKLKSGKNLFDAIINLRIEAAKDHLLHTELKTYEISELVGVDDASYFSKMFKKITGLTPKEFRKQGKNEK